MQTYKDIEYAKTRLNGSIVLRDIKGVKKAIYIDHITDDGIVVHSVMSTKIVETCPLIDLDITPVSLGYVNHKNFTSYLVRKPVRQDWRQGLRSVSAYFIGDTWSFNDIPHPILANTIEGIYPSFKQALGKTVNNPDSLGSIAFCRDFALYHSGELFFKSIHVGYVDKNGFVQWKAGFEYAEDAFREAL